MVPFGEKSMFRGTKLVFGKFDNPFLSTQARDILNAQGASTFYLSRASTDLILARYHGLRFRRLPNPSLKQRMQWSDFVSRRPDCRKAHQIVALLRAQEIDAASRLLGIVHNPVEQG